MVWFCNVSTLIMVMTTEVKMHHRQTLHEGVQAATIILLHTCLLPVAEDTNYVINMAMHECDNELL